jgi:CubicO group peptidase (beta-lactamase class C family)
MRIPPRSILLLLAPFVAATAQAPDRSKLATRIDSVVREFIAARRTPGLSLAILRGSDTIVMSAYGVANIETKQPATPATIYRIGSMTKQFTSALIMRQFERGKLSLDDDITKHLPGVPTHGQRVSIRQLLNHTSGIHNYTESSEWQKHQEEDVTPQQIVAFVAADTLDFPPGTKYRYSNTGYVLLGMILEKVAGEPYAELLQREILTPLGLRETSYCPSRPTDPAFATGYEVGPNGASPAPYRNMTHAYAAGAICATARDFVRWQRALASGRVVAPASYALMTTPDTLNNGRRLGYGFGLELTQVSGHTAIMHGGSTQGFISGGFVFPADSLNIVLLTNSNVSPSSLALSIARILLDVPSGPVRGSARTSAPVPQPLADGDRDRLLGVYDLGLPGGGTRVVRIAVEQGELVAHDGQRSLSLVHRGNLRFATLGDREILLTFVEENGKVSSLRFQQGSVTLVGSRRP